MQISRAGVKLFLSEHFGDGTPGKHVHIPITGVDAFQRELIAKKYRNARPGVEDTPWGSRNLTVSDPFGNRLCFSEEKSA